MIGMPASRIWNRVFIALAMAVIAYAVLAPLSSLDVLQSLGMPLLTDKLWFRLATITAMFVVMASAWNIIGGLTGYAAFGNVAFFGIGAYTVGMLITKARWPFLLALPDAFSGGVGGGHVPQYTPEPCPTRSERGMR